LARLTLTCRTVQVTKSSSISAPPHVLVVGDDVPSDAKKVVDASVKGVNVIASTLFYSLVSYPVDGAVACDSNTSTNTSTNTSSVLAASPARTPQSARVLRSRSRVAKPHALQTTPIRSNLRTTATHAASTPTTTATTTATPTTAALPPPSASCSPLPPSSPSSLLTSSLAPPSPPPLFCCETLLADPPSPSSTIFSPCAQNTLSFAPPLPLHPTTATSALDTDMDGSVNAAAATTTTTTDASVYTAPTSLPDFESHFLSPTPQAPALLDATTYGFVTDTANKENDHQQLLQYQQQLLPQPQLTEDEKREIKRKLKQQLKLQLKLQLKQQLKEQLQLLESPQYTTTNNNTPNNSNNDNHYQQPACITHQPPLDLHDLQHQLHYAQQSDFLPFTADQLYLLSPSSSSNSSFVSQHELDSYFGDCSSYLPPSNATEATPLFHTKVLLESPGLADANHATNCTATIAACASASVDPVASAAVDELLHMSAFGQPQMRPLEQTRRVNHKRRLDSPLHSFTSACPSVSPSPSPSPSPSIYDSQSISEFDASEQATKRLRMSTYTAAAAAASLSSSSTTSHNARNTKILSAGITPVAVAATTTISPRTSTTHNKRLADTQKMHRALNSLQDITNTSSTTAMALAAAANCLSQPLCADSNRKPLVGMYAALLGRFALKRREFADRIVEHGGEVLMNISTRVCIAKCMQYGATHC
jgi:hypothetical protein